MALIKCPECGKEISDKSEICVGCGFPIKEYLCKKEENGTEERRKREQQEKERKELEEQYLCSSCGKQNEIGEDYCANCGNRLTPYLKTNYDFRDNSEDDTEENRWKDSVSLKTPFWKKTWFVILMCVFLPPLGLALLWYVKKPKYLVGRILLTTFLALYSLFWIVSIVAGTSSTEEKNETEISQEFHESAEETKEGFESAEETEEVLTEENIVEPEETEEEYKASCKEYKYKDVLRNPEDYVGNRVKITVKISSVHEASWLNDGKYYFAYSNDEYDWWVGDRYGVFDRREEQNPKLLEDDIITVYGEISDPEYTSSLIVNGSETFCIDMKYIDFISE